MAIEKDESRKWREKLHNPKNGLPQVKKVTGKMSKRWGTGKFVIPHPEEVDALMKKVSKGKLVTISEIREALAKKHKVNFACPLTTGIFAWIAAGAADEEEKEGKKGITPYWRTLKSGGEINDKFPGGAEDQMRLLKSEGHKIVKKGKKYKVLDFENKLAKI